MTDEIRCPKCQSTNRAQILWGLVRGKNVKEAKKRKEIVLGGCILPENAPRWQCNECKTRWGIYDPPKKIDPKIIEMIDMEKSRQEKKEKISYSQEYIDVFGDENEKPLVKEDKKIEKVLRPEDKKIEEIPARIWLKKELASAIGITICGRCGTHTKMVKTHPDSEGGWYGYTICPKCGHKEKWLSGTPYYGAS